MDKIYKLTVVFGSDYSVHTYDNLDNAKATIEDYRKVGLTDDNFSLDEFTHNKTINIKDI